MTKRVVNSEQVLHLWAHQAQDSARNGTGSVFFEGDTCYSYGRHFPMGTIYKRKDEILVLLTTERRSVTTAQHLSSACRAVSHLPCAYVSDVLAGKQGGIKAHQYNLKQIAAAIETHRAKASRAMQARTVEWRRESAESLEQNAARYAAFFDKRLKIPAFPAADFDAALERAKRIENPDPVRDAKKFKARERRQAAQRAALQGEFDAYCAAVIRYNKMMADYLLSMPQSPADYWRETGRWPQSAVPGRPYAGYKKAREFDRAGFTLPEISEMRPHHSGDGHSALLRVNGNEIETSQGARIPLDHAPRIWRLVCAARASGRDYARDGHTEHAGAFAIDAITAAGDLRAGCHYLAYAEIERMARELGFLVRGDNA